MEWFGSSLRNMRGWLGRRELKSASRAHAPGRCRRRNRKARIEQLEPRLVLSAMVELLGVPTWVDEGPSAILDGVVEGMSSQGDPVIGAIEAVAPHPTMADTIYVGTVNGGVWKSTNATSTSPDWSPLTDEFPSLSISAIDLDPTDQSYNTLIAGIGRVSSFAKKGGLLTGLLRTTDGGSTWVQVGEASTSQNGGLKGENITSVVERGDTILVAADKAAGDTTPGQGGVFRATVNADGTISPFTRLSGQGNLPDTPVVDLVGLPDHSDLQSGPQQQALKNTFYVGIADSGSANGVYKTTDGGNNWTNITTGALDTKVSFLRTENIRIAVHRTPSNENVLYVGVVNSVEKPDGEIIGPHLTGFLRSNDGGATWVAMDLPETTENQGQPDERQEGLHPGEKGTRFFSIVAHPENANVVYVGGDRQPEAKEKDFEGATPSPNSIGATTFTGRLFRGDSGQASGSQWAALTHDFADPDGTDPLPKTAPHADSRNMAFDADDNLLEVDDGGIYRRSDPLTGTGVWTSANGNLQITEFFSIAFDTFTDVIFGGSQDNGTPEQVIIGSKQWADVTGGDGGFVAVDNVSNPDESVRYVTAQQLLEFERRTDPIGGVVTSDPVLLKYRNKPLSDNDKSIFAPTLNQSKAVFDVAYELNAVDPKRMVVGTRSIYESDNRGDSLNRIQSQRPGAVSTFAYGWKDPTGAMDKPDVIYAARKNGKLFVRETMDSDFIKHRAPKGSVITDIQLDPDDWRIAYAVDKDNVWIISNAGAGWTNITGSLPGKNLGNISGIEVVSTSNGKALLVGGIDGVYVAFVNPGDPTSFNTSWSVFGDGLPHVNVRDLFYEPQDDLLVVGTIGRGAWSVSGVAQELGELEVLKIDGSSGNDTIELRRSDAVMGAIEVLDDGVIIDTVPWDAVRGIEVNGMGGNDTLIVNLENGTVSPFFPIHFNGGAGGNDTLIVKTDDFVSRRSLTNVGGVGEIRVLTNGGLQIVSFDDVETPDVSQVNQPNEDVMGVIRSGLEELSDWSRSLDDPLLLGARIPVVGATLGRALNRVPFQDQRKVVDPVSGANQASTGPFSPGSQILRRVFEEASNGFQLDEIGAAISDPQSLVQRLDDLDSTPGNVSLSQPPGTFLFNVEIESVTLSGMSAFDVEGLGGKVALSGTLDISADISIHIVFGVDDEGFFIDANGPRDDHGEPVPEISVTNLQIDGEVTVDGRFGFLEVLMPSATLSVDPTIELTVDLVEPGPDAVSGVIDGLIRLDELSSDPTQLARLEISPGSPAVDDVILTGTFEVAAVLPGSSSPFTLIGAEVDIVWQNIEDPDTLSVEAGAGSDAQDLIDFLQMSSSQIISGLMSVTNWLDAISDEGLLGTRIPGIGKSLGEILDGTPQEVLFANQGALEDGPVFDISGVFEERGLKKFVVTIIDNDLLKAGIGVGDTVEYAGIDSMMPTTFTGEIDRVDVDQFTVSFNSSVDQDPDTVSPLFKIQPSGSLKDRLRSSLGPLTDITRASIEFPTLQSLVRELAEIAGVDANTIPINSSVSGADRVIEMTLPFDPDPMIFSRRLDLSDALGGLTFGASGDFQITVDPAFQLTVGMRLDPNLPWEERFYVKENLEDEITVEVTAQLDEPNVFGAIGFLDVILEEIEQTVVISPSSTTNNLDGTFTVELMGADFVADGIEVGDTVDYFVGAMPALGVVLVVGMDQLDIEMDANQLGLPDGDVVVDKNDGLKISGTITVNVIDPGVGGAKDGKINLTELRPTDLTDVFKADINAVFDVDGLKLSANVGQTTLGSLDLVMPDHPIGKLEDLLALPQVIAGNISGNVGDFLDFNNITP